MKKFMIALALILVCGSTMVVFSVPERIHYAFNGMAGYAPDRYEQLVSELPKRTLDIDLSDLPKTPFTVYAYDENVRIELDSVDFHGDGYTFKFVSYGESSFSSGSILRFADCVEDLYINNDDGEFIYQLTGEEGFKHDTFIYYFDLYPSSDKVSEKDLAEMRFTFTVPMDITLVNYNRKPLIKVYF